jgi:putative FmdB family regulatory protein
MPIYEYACTDCGHQGEHMQKLADAPLTVCPSCGKSTYSKKISAAGFALKGSGWYVTDYRNGNKPPAKSGDKADSSESSKASSDTATAPVSGAADAKAAAPAPAPAPAPASAPAVAG